MQVDDRIALPEAVRITDVGRPLRIGWLISPPAAGSGGHTTIFRMVEGLQAAGHTCVIFLYDRHGVDVEERSERIRAFWPHITGEIRDSATGLSNIDACIATSWETAHVLASRGVTPMSRLYFIQDYEPFFYPRGSEYELAAMTYRFPYRRIALGKMVTNCLKEELELESDFVPFGCDTETYRLRDNPSQSRNGVTLYCKPDVARRGYRIAENALALFHREHPSQEIHLYGSPGRDLQFPATYHGRLDPTALNDLYNETITGIAMSFTNISLVAEEMLASGTIPVVNDSAMSRADLDSPFVRWARPTAHGLAEQLSAAVSNSDVNLNAVRAAESVADRSWREAQQALVKIVEDEVLR